MQHGGRGNADLRRFRYHAGEEVVVGTLDWPGVADRRLDVHGRRAKADLAAVVPAEGGGELAVSDGDAVEALQAIDMEEGAAELAVGDALEPDVLLALHHLADAVVLDPAHGLAGPRDRRVLPSRPAEAPWPQKAST